MNLISKGTTNAKTKKNRRESVIMYMSPDKQNSKGISVCPMASKGCSAACLYNSGRGKFNSVQEARIRKTEYYLSDKQGFAEQLLKELGSLSKRASKLGIEIAVRLNGTSDLDLLSLIKNRTGVDPIGIPNLIYYDYTKILGKIKKYIDTPYRITFSKSETNWDECVTALELGAPVSVVFSTTKKEELPQTYMGYKVLDGDSADDIMLDEPGGYILGLRFKGSKKEMLSAIDSGFVIDVKKI